MTKKKTPFETYLETSKDPITSLILVAPVFVLYQMGIFLPGVDMKNGADFVTGTLWRGIGYNGWIYTAINLVVLAAVVGLYLKRREKGKLTPKVAGAVVAESTLYAFLMGGLAVRLLTAIGIHPPLVWPAADSSGGGMNVTEAIVMSLGAGAYEELVFRLVLMGAALWGLEKLEMPKTKRVIIAVVATSLLFSLVHYKPIGMDSWELGSFAFRAVLGVFLAGLYATRGFAVAVYTHAIYDLFILVPRALG